MLYAQLTCEINDLKQASPILVPIPRRPKRNYNDKSIPIFLYDLIWRPDMKTRVTLLLRPKARVPMMNDVSPMIQSARSLILKNLKH